MKFLILIVTFLSIWSYDLVSQAQVTLGPKPQPIDYEGTLKDSNKKIVTVCGINNTGRKIPVIPEGADVLVDENGNVWPADTSPVPPKARYFHCNSRSPDADKAAADIQIANALSDKRYWEKKAACPADTDGLSFNAQACGGHSKGDACRRTSYGFLVNGNCAVVAYNYDNTAPTSCECQ